MEHMLVIYRISWPSLRISELSRTHYNENAGKPWIRQKFFRQCFKITILPKNFTAKVLFYTVFSKLFYWRYYLSLLKATFLCVVSSTFITAFKVLYKESIETVDRPSIKLPTKKSNGNGFQTRRHFL